jgi:hypothetical protein
MKNTAKSSRFIAIEFTIDIYLALQLCTKTLERTNVL